MCISRTAYRLAVLAPVCGGARLAEWPVGVGPRGVCERGRARGVCGRGGTRRAGPSAGPARWLSRVYRKLMGVGARAGACERERGSWARLCRSTTQPVGLGVHACVRAGENPGRELGCAGLRHSPWAWACESACVRARTWVVGVPWSTETTAPQTAAASTTHRSRQPRRLTR